MDDKKLPMVDEEVGKDLSPDPSLDPKRSPGFGEKKTNKFYNKSSIDEYTCTDTSPLENKKQDRIIELLNKGNKNQRKRAALALSDNKNELSDKIRNKTIDTLSKKARTDDDPEVRQFSVESLSKFDGDKAEKTIKDVLLDDEDPWVRAEAVWALDSIDKDRHSELIELALNWDDHHAVQRNAAYSIFKRKKEDSLDILLDLTEGNNTRLREWGVYMLGCIKDENEKAEKAIEKAKKDKDEIVRRTAKKVSEKEARVLKKYLDQQAPENGDVLNRQPTL